MFFLTNSGSWHPSIEPFVKSTCFLLIVYLLGFVIASYQSLCDHIKTCLTPSASSQAEEPQTSKDNSKTVEPMTLARRWRLILGILILLVLTYLQFINLQGGTFQTFPNHIASLLYISLIFVVGGAVVSFSTMFMTRVSVLKSPILATFFAASIGYFAVITPLGLYESNTEFSVWVITLSLVHFMCGGVSGKKGCRLYMFFNSLNLYIFIRYSAENLSQDGEDIWPRLVFQGIYVAFLPAALVSFGPGGLIAFMLRFDFKNHLDRSGLSLVTRPDDSSNEPQEVVIKVGSDLFAMKFPKPYFTAAIITWSFIRIVTIGLCLTTGFPAKSPYDACFCAVLVEFPIMMVAIYYLAVVRGEIEVLRNYKENWSTLTKSDKVPAAQPEVDVVLKTTANDDLIDMII